MHEPEAVFQRPQGKAGIGHEFTIPGPGNSQGFPVGFDVIALHARQVLGFFPDHEGRGIGHPFVLVRVCGAGKLRGRRRRGVGVDLVMGGPGTDISRLIHTHDVQVPDPLRDRQNQPAFLGVGGLGGQGQGFRVCGEQVVITRHEGGGMQQEFRLGGPLPFPRLGVGGGSKGGRHDRRGGEGGDLAGRQRGGTVGTDHLELVLGFGLQIGKGEAVPQPEGLVGYGTGQLFLFSRNAIINFGRRGQVGGPCYQGGGGGQLFHLEAVDLGDTRPVKGGPQKGPPVLGGGEEVVVEDREGPDPLLVTGIGGGPVLPVLGLEDPARVSRAGVKRVLEHLHAVEVQLPRAFVGDMPVPAVRGSVNLHAFGAGSSGVEGAVELVEALDEMLARGRHFLPVHPVLGGKDQPRGIGTRVEPVLEDPEAGDGHLAQDAHRVPLQAVEGHYPSLGTGPRV